MQAEQANMVAQAAVALQVGMQLLEMVEVQSMVQAAVVQEAARTVVTLLVMQAQAE
jgi:hypothetical protein